jgi:hypothetical protein
MEMMMLFHCWKRPKRENLFFEERLTTKEKVVETNERTLEQEEGEEE